VISSVIFSASPADTADCDDTGHAIFEATHGTAPKSAVETHPDSIVPTATNITNNPNFFMETQ
jgi:isocitrate dehydrogenase